MLVAPAHWTSEEQKVAARKLNDLRMKPDSVKCCLIFTDEDEGYEAGLEKGYF